MSSLTISSRLLGYRAVVVDRRVTIETTVATPTAVIDPPEHAKHG
jgi:hypothetical protein